MAKQEDIYGDHISHQFNDDLAGLKEDFLRMGGMVEEQVGDAIDALIDGDGHRADEIRARDKQVDRLELEIDEEATRIIARRQPAARDLRLVISVIKMVADLERIGDEAKKIAKFAVSLSQEGQAPRGYVEVRHIGSHVIQMVRDALDAFARLDSEQALRIMKADKRVDEEYQAATRTLITFMMEDPRNISRCMSVMWVLRALERVGDHACNMAEHVIFMAKGEDVRHTPVEEAEKIVGR
ncbi:MAG: phosphate transport system regulatory protein PhoU [Alteromonadaceae bacterium]|uniref:phosphate signaling complex protein PhoU n=1 Tax=unclassified Marinobacter TaxID=83889 RepID=UPI000C3C9868|nr:phosphate signaling complex protein PhoU [Marinobacter sp. BGYM27]MAA64585.1 phosphate transport system regulatory protein PhoU [Alteromonadaceae bacterium]MBH84804.1 phosphate transport system regulatory protein PhoU [Alteromonadaceae bacterium]MDG5501460.1 phosphate signaling complex protein PhoU [Marinobacter sp. BGYM27]|tara:strand:- start:28984 stop:29703 length:720 start_codon:yes stop_codon:yes gene_type:complete